MFVVCKCGIRKQNVLMFVRIFVRMFVRMFVLTLCKFGCESGILL